MCFYDCKRNALLSILDIEQKGRYFNPCHLICLHDMHFSFLKGILIFTPRRYLKNETRCCNAEGFGGLRRGCWEEDILGFGSSCLIFESMPPILDW